MFARIALLAMLWGTLQCAEAMEYHGFQIDESLLQEANRAQAIALVSPSIIEQINIVESAGLPPGILDFFRRTKIVLDPAALYTQEAFFPKRGEQGSVHLPIARLSATTPALLFGLMRAYQFNVLGSNLAEINKAYQNARAETDYPPTFMNSNFLTSPQNFFALTSTLYLLGRLPEPPFDCTILSKSDSQYLLFLSDMFGRPGCDPNSPALTPAFALAPASPPGSNTAGPQLTILRRPQPVYPASARTNHEEGTATARVQIDESGQVKTVNVTRSSGYESLDQAAEDAISKAIFKPYILNGKPTQVSILMSIKFEISKQKNAKSKDGKAQ